MMIRSLIFTSLYLAIHVHATTNTSTTTSTPTSTPPTSPSNFTCASLSSWNKCYNVLNYNIDANTCQHDKDALFDTTAYASLSQPCRVAVSRVQCAQRYPPCASPNATIPSYLCQDITTSCTSLTDQALVAGLNMTLPWSCPNINDTAITSPYQFVSTASTAPGYPTCFMLPSDSICAPYISTPVMLPYNTTQASQAAVMATAQAANIVLGPATGNCYQLYYQTVCRETYPPCKNVTFNAIIPPTNNSNNETTVTVPLSYPALPCRSLCEQMISTCNNGFISSYIKCDTDTKTITSCAGPTLITYSSYPDNATSIPFPLHAPLLNATSKSTPPSLANVPMICSIPEVPPVPPPMQCIPLPSSSVCSGVLSYQVANTTCFTGTEAVLDVRTWVALSSTCRNAVAQYQCTTSYQPCQGSPGNVTITPIKPSGDVCITLKTCLSGNSTSAQVMQKLIGMDPNSLTCDTNTNNNIYTSPPAPQYSQCTTYTGSICKNIIQAPIFASAFPTPIEIEALLSPLTTVLPLIPRAYGCRDNLMRVFCASTFPSCDIQSVRNQMHVDADIPMPVFASQSACQLASQTCGLARNACIAAGGDTTTCRDWLSTLQINCAGSVIIGGGCASGAVALPQFPIGIQSTPGFPPGPNAPNITYSPNQANQTIDAFVMTCPEPFVTPDNWNSPNIVQGGSCATPCTSFFWSPEAWSRNFDVVQSISIVSFIMIAFLNIAWFLPTAKSFSRLWSPLHWFVICAFWVELSIVLPWFSNLRPLPGLDHRASSICKSNSEPYTQNDGGLCVAQAVIFNFVIPAVNSYLNAMVIDAICMTMFKNAHKWPKKYHQIRHGIYHVAAVAFGLAFVLVENDLGSNGVTAFCSGTPGNGSGWDFIVTYNHFFPAVTTFGLCLVLGMIVRSGYRSGSTTHVWKKTIKLISTYSRLFWMIIIYVTILVYTNVLAIESHENVQNWTDKATNWFTCIFQSGDLHAVSKGICERPVAYSEGDWIAGLTIMPNLLGIFVTLVYISRADFIAYHDFVILCLQTIGITRYQFIGYDKSTTTDKDQTGQGSEKGGNSGQQTTGVPANKLSMVRSKPSTPRGPISSPTSPVSRQSTISSNYVNPNIPMAHTSDDLTSQDPDVTINMPPTVTQLLEQVTADGVVHQQQRPIANFTRTSSLSQQHNTTPTIELELPPRHSVAPRLPTWQSTRPPSISTSSQVKPIVARATISSSPSLSPATPTKERLPAANRI